MNGPPPQLLAVAAEVNERLAELLERERRTWTGFDPSLKEPLGDLSDLVLGGGKRIRPAYCHWGWLLGSGSSTTEVTSTNKKTRRTAADQPAPATVALDVGCALEILHAFALAHDDVMDASLTRRGAASVWHKFVQRHQSRGWHGEARRFGEAAAVLVGDMAMVLADRTLGQVSNEVRDVWNGLRTELNMGQYLDVLASAHRQGSATQARRIMEYKTARYTVVRPLQLGAALAGRTDLSQLLRRHSYPVGMAFQLRDDVLGAFGDPATTGKPVGDDLREGKTTLLMALAHGAASSSQLKILQTAHRQADDEAIHAIQQVIVDTGALKQVEQEITQLLDKALDALTALPNVPEARQALEATARFVTLRHT